MPDKHDSRRQRRDPGAGKVLKIVVDPKPTPALAAPALPEHYFRHESGRLVSVLSRRFGVHRVELCEDAVQTALLRAVQSWSQRGLPDDKSAWLYRVAMNEVLGASAPTHAEKALLRRRLQACSTGDPPEPIRSGRAASATG